MWTRRNSILSAGCLAIGGLPTFARAQAARARGPGAEGEVLPRLKIFVPAGAGGGWDQVGRHLGSVLQSAGAARQVDYENKGGQGGIVGLEDFSARHAGDPGALIVGGLVMVGAVALSHKEALFKQVVPVARLTSDYLVLAVPAASPFQSFKDLAASLQQRPDRVTFTGGSAGGVDHMLAAMLLRALKADVAALRYTPTSSGKDAVAALQRGDATVAISGYSEFKAAFDAKVLRPLAVSSRRGNFGIASLREQGVATDLANWRGVFASANTSPDQRDTLARAVVRATESAAWHQSLQDNQWIGSTLTGKELQNFIALEQAMASTVVSLLKLEKT